MRKIKAVKTFGLFGGDRSEGASVRPDGMTSDDVAELGPVSGSAVITPKQLAPVIGYRFKCAELLEQAFIHPSFRYEQGGVVADNQRLEFLGDAVLGLLSADALYRVCSADPEGLLTQRRSQMTSGKALAAVAREAGLGLYLRLGKGEWRSGGHIRQGNLADLLEALFGAAWLDGGVKAVQRMFDTLLLPVLPGPEHKNLQRANPKGMLQEMVQARWKQAPVYMLVDTNGPAHAQVFTVSVTLPDGRMWEGTGAGRQSAEVAAASKALDALDTAPDAS
ncbi:MAG: ribonuclease III [Kiritimatiellia bacterium]